MNNWYTLKDKLPNHGQMVLICFGPDRTQSLARYYNTSARGEVWLDGIYGKIQYAPDFWMPLPFSPAKPDPFMEWYKSSTFSVDKTSSLTWYREIWDAAINYYKNEQTT